MNNKNVKCQSLTVKGNGLPTVKNDFYVSVDEANKRISKAIKKIKLKKEIVSKRHVHLLQTFDGLLS